MQPFLRLRDYAFDIYITVVAHSDKLFGWKATIMEMKKTWGIKFNHQKCHIFFMILYVPRNEKILTIEVAWLLNNSCGTW